MGAMTFGREADEATSFALADYYVEQGGFFFDTANIYSDGGAEETLGKWIKARGNRDSLVVASKVFGAMHGGYGDPPRNNRGLSRFHIVREVENSLRRLQTDVIDIYQVHRWDYQAPVDETVRALDDMIRQGKIRYVGACNLKGWMPAEYIRLADASLTPRFISLQQAYSAVNRSAELEVFELCRHHGLGVMTYNPLAGGLLTGKYSRDSASPPDVRLTTTPYYRERYITADSLALAERFVAHAGERSVSPAALALAWVMAEERVHTPILGARTVEQLADTMAGGTLTLTHKERAAVPAVLPGRWVGKDPVYDRTDP